MNKGIYWLLHICAGVLLLVLLGFHMIIMHLNDIIASITGSSFKPLRFQSVAIRGENLYYLIFYLVFLFIALYHSLYGLKNVLVECFCSERSEKRIYMLVWLCGIVLFVIGSYSTFKFFTM